MKIKWVIFLLLVIFVSLVGTIYIKDRNEKQQDYGCDHCNILLIDIDVLGADELPCYGYSRNTAPNLCDFAKKSVFFKSNFSAAAWTLPSIFSTTTSWYPAFHDIKVVIGDKLNTEVPTLAGTLKNAGYYTVWLGLDAKNAAYLSSENNGLKDYDLIIDEDNILDLIAKLPKSKPWFIHYYNDDLHLPYSIPEGETLIDESMKAPKKLPITDSDFRKLMEKTIRKDYKTIFTQKGIEAYPFVFLSTEESKDDLILADLFFSIKGTNKESVYLNDWWAPIRDTYLSSFDTKNKTDVDYVKMMYDTKLSILDREMGEVLNLFASKEDTVTVVMSDHGESFGEHGLFTHIDDYHSELFFTPLMIYSPKLKNKIINQTSSNIDIFPTLLDLVNVPQIDGLQGKSLVNYINNEGIGTSRFVFGETNEGLVLQNEDWLYFSPFISESVNKTLLYNKKLDPNEEKNVVNDYPELAGYLFSQTSTMNSHKKEVSNRKSQSIYSLPNNISPEKIKQLQKQGYF